MSEWQPIETAPKDGTWIICFFPERTPEIAVTKWCSPHSYYIEHFAIEGNWTPGIDPTHWMPLLKGPKE